MKKRNPVKKNMDKFHKPCTHKDKTKYDRKSVSQNMMDDLEPIVHGSTTQAEWENEGGAVHSDVPYVHPTEYDESDDLEDAKVISDEYRKLEKDMDYSGAFESDIEE
jgi:hypothetical protein